MELALPCTLQVFNTCSCHSHVPFTRRKSIGCVCGSRPWKRSGGFTPGVEGMCKVIGLKM